MRLWAEQLISRLPRQQLLGQHRECAALRGNGWGKPHSVVNYVFTYPAAYLVRYHLLIMEEMAVRGYNVAPEWRNPVYRGQRCEPFPGLDMAAAAAYPEHDERYVLECLENLKTKGIEL